jgi:hypothetical protein
VTDERSGDGAAGGGATPDRFETVLALLSHPVRRHALLVLRERDCAVTLDELAHAVALREHGVTLGESVGDRFERVRVYLHHNHLPKLRAADVVAYDPDRETVELAANSEYVDRLLDDVSFVE